MLLLLLLLYLLILITKCWIDLDNVCQLLLFVFPFAWTNAWYLTNNSNEDSAIVSKSSFVHRYTGIQPALEDLCLKQSRTAFSQKGLLIVKLVLVRRGDCIRSTREGNNTSSHNRTFVCHNHWQGCVLWRIFRRREPHVSHHNYGPFDISG